MVALGALIGDPIIGLLITVVILKITWDSWRTVSTTEPGELDELHKHYPRSRFARTLSLDVDVAEREIEAEVVDALERACNQKWGAEADAEHGPRDERGDRPGE